MHITYKHILRGTHKKKNKHRNVIKQVKRIVLNGTTTWVDGIHRIICVLTLEFLRPPLRCVFAMGKKGRTNILITFTHPRIYVKPRRVSRLAQSWSFICALANSQRRFGMALELRLRALLGVRAKKDDAHKWCLCTPSTDRAFCCVFAFGRYAPTDRNNSCAKHISIPMENL